jgi:hypothetical protein
MLQYGLDFTCTMDSYVAVRIDAAPRVTWTWWWRGVPVSCRRVGLERYRGVYASSLLPAIKPAELGHDMIPRGPHCHIDINVRRSLHGITLFFFRFVPFSAPFLLLSSRDFFFFSSLRPSVCVFPANSTFRWIESVPGLNFDFSPSHRVIYIPYCDNPFIRLRASNKEEIPGADLLRHLYL